MRVGIFHDDKEHIVHLAHSVVRGTLCGRRVPMMILLGFRDVDKFGGYPSPYIECHDCFAIVRDKERLAAKILQARLDAAL
ncbi:MAG: hypothetical protein ABSD38_34125 [Syntrophorhabdales bacterium]|jgi:hypothetical protein